MERWYWVELIGFDNESPDFGVSAYLSRNRSTTGVSLLFAHIDFLFAQENAVSVPEKKPESNTSTIIAIIRGR